MPKGKAETPNRRHGEDQDNDIEDDVGDGGSKERGVIVDTPAVRIRPYPGSFDGYALEEDGEDDCDTPTNDEGEDNVAGVFEGFTDTEETEVEEEDGYLDEGHTDAIKDFVGDGRLEDFVRNAANNREGRR